MRSAKQRKASSKYAQMALRFAANVAKRKRLGKRLAERVHYPMPDPIKWFSLNKRA